MSNNQNHLLYDTRLCSIHAHSSIVVPNSIVNTGLSHKRDRRTIPPELSASTPSIPFPGGGPECPPSPSLSPKSPLHPSLILI
ncbi:hypothetical protein CEXT_642571 [Caerostris extrusa]|uniref:Uncharacterized protein n=1 Tax=Caerostris extrusa TaxID=172846 RepID=A0AAV4S1U3_CAEEX|nr:hypothetical protein CEXT_642571 [Caerostris extrusa]